MFSHLGNTQISIHPICITIRAPASSPAMVVALQRRFRRVRVWGSLELEFRFTGAPTIEGDGGAQWTGGGRRWCRRPWARRRATGGMVTKRKQRVREGGGGAREAAVGTGNKRRGEGSRRRGKPAGLAGHRRCYWEAAAG